MLDLPSPLVPVCDEELTRILAAALRRSGGTMTHRMFPCHRVRRAPGSAAGAGRGNGGAEPSGVIDVGNTTPIGREAIVAPLWAFLDWHLTIGCPKCLPISELIMARWSMPMPPKFLAGKKTDPGVTNISNPNSPHWRRWLGVESRWLVPFTSFAEPDNGIFGGRAAVWFGFDESRPLACFAVVWTNWTSVRKVREGEVTADAFAFLTIKPNAEVGAIHPKAMPAILRTSEEIETRLSAPPDEASNLQRPLPDGSLRIVGRLAN